MAVISNHGQESNRQSRKTITISVVFRQKEKRSGHVVWEFHDIPAFLFAARRHNPAARRIQGTEHA